MPSKSNLALLKVVWLWEFWFGFGSLAFFWQYFLILAVKF